MFEALFKNSGVSMERLRTLCLVAKHGGITRAAAVIDKENVATKQSLFSRQIKELETFFQVELLDRETQPHQLTDAGRQLAEISTQALGQLDDFTLNCGNQPFRLNIGAGESIIQWLLIPALEKFREQLPTASVRLFNRTSENIVAGLMDSDLDLGLLREGSLNKTLDHLPIGSFGYRLFVPKGMRKRFGAVVTLKEIATLPIATLEGNGDLRSAIKKLAADQKVELNIPVDCSSLTQIAYAVGTYSYAGVLPEFASKILNMDRISSHEIAGFKLRRELVVAWSKRRAESRPVIRQAAETLERSWKSS